MFTLMTNDTASYLSLVPNSETIYNSNIINPVADRSRNILSLGQTIDDLADFNNLSLKKLDITRSDSSIVQKNSLVSNTSAGNLPLNGQSISPRLPDLSITDISLKITGVGSRDLQLNYTIANKGGVGASAGSSVTKIYLRFVRVSGEPEDRGASAGSSVTKIYLSRDTILDNSDVFLTGDNVTSVGAGNSLSKWVNLSIRDTIAPGNYYTIAQADSWNDVAESNENNNIALVPLTITPAAKPDLTVGSVKASQSIVKPNWVNVTYTLNNRGTVNTGSFANNTKFYLSSDISLDNRDIYTGLNTTHNIDAGKSQTQSLELNIFNKVETGNYYLIAQTDADNNIDESNENNNSSSAIVTIVISRKGYSTTDGYGLVNGATAVAKASGKNSFAKVPDIGGNAWGADMLNAPSVWAQGYTGQGIVVAVLDTGVDRAHRDLSANIWKNTKEIANNGKDDDGNGYVDDVWGWNTANNNNNTLDISGHGTHVAGIIAGVKNNFGVTGIAYNAKIMPVKVLDDRGRGSSSAVARGIRYAVDNGARVINMSLGGDYNNNVMKEAIQYAASKGVITVMAAGNEGKDSPTYPGYFATDWGVVVGAVDSNGNLPNFSNRAGNKKLAYVTAPGVNIYSTSPSNGYTILDGTSMATAYVGGIVALMLSAKPDLKDTDVRGILTSTAYNSPPGDPGDRDLFGNIPGNTITTKMKIK